MRKQEKGPMRIPTSEYFREIRDIHATFPESLEEDERT